jgi:hypothetical protein
MEPTNIVYGISEYISESATKPLLTTEQAAIDATARKLAAFLNTEFGFY